VKKGSDSRSLEAEGQLFTLTLAEAKEMFAQPKARGRGARATTPPLRELGEDPATGKPMVIKDGRFGPYVTDGETNASLRKDDDVASITVQRAAELLAERRAAPPVARRRTTTTRTATTRKKSATTARSASKRS
jgi:DNA topoisomerase I